MAPHQNQTIHPSIHPANQPTNRADLTPSWHHHQVISADSSRGKRKGAVSLAPPSPKVHWAEMGEIVLTKKI